MGSQKRSGILPGKPGIEKKEEQKSSMAIKLWTFQSILSVNELNETGELKAKWQRYKNQDNWKNAYLWMRDQMESHGINCRGYAPIWAFHSFGKYSKPPTLGDARSLLSDLEIEGGIKTIEFNCPNELMLLSNYYGWCNILDEFIMGKNISVFDEKLMAALYDTNPKNLSKHNAIQATLPFLKKEWVIEIRDLKLKTGYDGYDKLELV